MPILPIGYYIYFGGLAPSYPLPSFGLGTPSPMAGSLCFPDSRSLLALSGFRPGGLASLLSTVRFQSYSKNKICQASFSAPLPWGRVFRNLTTSPSSVTSMIPVAPWGREEVRTSLGSVVASVKSEIHPWLLFHQVCSSFSTGPAMTN